MLVLNLVLQVLRLMVILKLMSIQKVKSIPCRVMKMTLRIMMLLHHHLLWAGHVLREKKAISYDYIIYMIEDCWWERHLWDHKNPYYGCEARDREKSGTSGHHKGDLPRFGPQRCVKPYDPTLVDVFSVLELLN